MATTQRQLLIDAIKERLSGMLLAGGYSTDAGRRVFDSRDPLGEPFNDKELPALWFRDTQNEISNLGADVDEHSLTLEIGVHEFSDNAPRSGRAIEGDLLAVVGVDPRFGGLCHYCRPTGTTIEVKREGRWQVGVRATFDVKFRTKAFDPYTAHTGPQ